MVAVESELNAWFSSHVDHSGMGYPHGKYRTR